MYHRFQGWFVSAGAPLLQCFTQVHMLPFSRFGKYGYVRMCMYMSIVYVCVDVLVFTLYMYIEYNLSFVF